MRFEQPEIKRCCFCFPLRYGLIVLTYLGLASSISYLCIVQIKDVHDKIISDKYNALDIISLTLAIAEVISNIVFVFAAHMKNVKLLKITLICNLSVAMLCILKHVGVLGFYTVKVLGVVNILRKMPTGWALTKTFIKAFLAEASVIFLDTVTNYYIYLMALNETKKLEKNCEFRFVNNTAEAKCVMEFEELNEITDEEKREEDTGKGYICIEERTNGNQNEACSNSTAKTKCTMVSEEFKGE